MARPDPEENGRRLEAFLEKNGISRRTMAKAFKVSHPAILDWVSGKAPAAAEVRTAIDRWTNGAVPADGWDKPEDRERRRELSRVEPFRPTGTDGR